MLDIMFGIEFVSGPRLLRSGSQEAQQHANVVTGSHLHHGLAFYISRLKLRVVDNVFIDQVNVAYRLGNTDRIQARSAEAVDAAQPIFPSVSGRGCDDMCDPQPTR